MSARSLGRGRCPRCGEEGSVVVKWVGGKEYVYAVAGPGEVSVTAQGAVFKVLIAPASYLNATWLRAGVRFAPIAVEEVQHLLDMFHGEYTSYSARLEPGQALLVWPCKLLASTAEVSFSLAVAQPSPQPPPQPVSIAQLVAAAILARTLPRLLIAALLIAAGYLLYKWSKSS